MSIHVVTFIFHSTMSALQFEYLNKRTVLEAEILDVFINHLGLHTGKVSFKSVISIEHMVHCWIFSVVQCLVDVKKYEWHQINLISFFKVAKYRKRKSNFTIYFSLFTTVFAIIDCNRSPSWN
jgi:hypothetical protein